VHSPVRLLMFHTATRQVSVTSRWPIR